MKSRKRTPSADPTPQDSGFTLVETVLTVAITATLMLSLMNVLNVTMAANENSRERNALARDARFAMGGWCERCASRTNSWYPAWTVPFSGHDESIMDPGVLAVAMDPFLDRDLDGGLGCRQRWRRPRRRRLTRRHELRQCGRPDRNRRQQRWLSRQREYRKPDRGRRRELALGQRRCHRRRG